MASIVDFLRKTVQVALTICLVFEVYYFVNEISKKTIGISMSSAWEDRITYPSVTICPDAGLSISSRDWLTFFQHKIYLENG